MLRRTGERDSSEPPCDMSVTIASEPRSSDSQLPLSLRIGRAGIQQESPCRRAVTVGDQQGQCHKEIGPRLDTFEVEAFENDDPIFEQRAMCGMTRFAAAERFDREIVDPE